ncbi:MAG: restriction endonuclease subunit S [Solirubrobacteraceae bacterium]
MRPGDGRYPWVQIKRVAAPGTGHTPSRERPELWFADECVVPWFTLADVWQIRSGGRSVVTTTTERVSLAGIAGSSAVLHPAGTVLLSRTASVGFSAVMGTDMAVSQDYMTWTPGPQLDSRFLLYVLRGQRQEFARLMSGSTHKTIYMPDLLALRTPLPPVERQLDIAAFLDRECARIDHVLAELRAQRDAIDKLMEAAFGAMTIGKPEAALRRFVLSVSDGPFGSLLASEHYVASEQTRVIRLGNVGSACFIDDDRAFVADAYANDVLREHLVAADDVIIAGLGDTNQPLGRASVVPAHVLPALHKADCYRARVDHRKCLPQYLALALTYGPARQAAELLSRGATRARLNTTVTRDLPVPLASLDEQRTIIQVCDAAMSRASTTERELCDFATALAEYRDALIDEAVTGQLDVARLTETRMTESLAGVLVREESEVLAS